MSSFLIALALLSTTSCTEQAKEPAEEEQLLELDNIDKFISSNVPEYAKPRRVFYISDRGCSRCNKLFLKAAEEIHQRKNDQDYFLVAASKLRLDITYFIEHGDRVRLLKQKRMVEGFLDSSAVLYIKGKHLDSIAVLRSDQLEKQLEAIKNQQ